MKNIYVIVDTETTIEDTVADFGAVVVDSKGTILHSIGVLTTDFLDMDLFYDRKATGLWAKSGMKKRKANYEKMLNEGTRSIASFSAINRWLDRVAIVYSNPKHYNLMLTAYNLPFDMSKCANSGIDLSMFNDKFCLWQAALGNLVNRNYKKFILENHFFSDRTEKTGSKTIKTSAEVVSYFVTGNDLIEPHTALEDAQHHELPILLAVIKKSKWRKKTKKFNYRDLQLRDHYLVK